jgi:D-beta-D-heptose 7-phosphate kinase/D-beta-D-heptose 1-phosphate adenosyltransferase
MTVWVNGCFDLLHVGHLDLLEAASTMAGESALIVGVNSDVSIRGLKGAGKPIICLRHRIMMLEALSYVDQVVVIHGPNCEPELRAIRPDIVVKGSGYTIESMCQNERAAVDSYGGQIRFTEHAAVDRTTEIIRRAAQYYVSVNQHFLDESEQPLANYSV